MENSINILNQVQAGILKPHGRNHAKLLFLQLPKEEKIIKELFLNFKPTSTSEQLEDTKTYKNRKTNEIDTIITTIFLSAYGFAQLGYDLASVTTSSKQKAKINAGRKPNRDEFTFRCGMKSENSIKRIDDPPVNDWEKGFQNNIHALIILAGNDKYQLNQKYIEISDFLRKSKEGKILFFEEGEKMTKIVDGQSFNIEPFGYRDGLSRLKFFKKEEGNYLLDKNQLPLVLDEANGSFLVLRKLKQDVEKFNKTVQKLACKLDKSEHPSPQDLIEGQIMGRFKNGVPITLSSSCAAKETTPCKMQEFNDFNVIFFPKKKEIKLERTTYKDDQEGLKCPIHAHIRKANPRVKKLILPREAGQPRVIVRSSIPFKYSDKNQGLLFMCFQKNIFSQFIAIQRGWLNDKPYGELEESGLDSVVGQNSEAEDQEWNLNWNKEGVKIPFSIKEVVEFRGGEYFYAPCLDFFKNPVQNPIIINQIKKY